MGIVIFTGLHHKNTKFLERRQVGVVDGSRTFGCLHLNAFVCNSQFPSRHIYVKIVCP